MTRENGHQRTDSEIAVMDADEFKNKRRLREILESHEQVEDVVSQAHGEYVYGEIDEQGRNLVILWAVQRYIREIYNLLRNYRKKVDDTDEDDYPEDKYWHPTDQEALGLIELENSDDIVFRGLYDILHADDIYVENWTREQASRHGPSQTEAVSRHHTVPKQVSLNAYLLAKAFVNDENNLDVQFETSGLPTDTLEV